MVAFRYETLKYYYQNPDKREGLLADLREGMEIHREYVESRGQRGTTGGIRPEDFSIRDCFRALVENGEELFNAISFKKRGGFRIGDVLESSGTAVNMGDFASITGQFVWNKQLEGYYYPQALWPSLVENYQTQFLNGERFPGVGEFGYSAIEVVAENERYPDYGLNEEFVDAPPIRKRGFEVGITREMTILDSTGLVLRRAQGGGKWLGINKDIRCLMAATGYTNNYVRNGVASNTFLTTGGYINSMSVPLVSWQSWQAGELLLGNITDPNTGAPVILEAPKILVPLALRKTAGFVMSAGEVAMVDNTANPSTVRAYGSNPAQQSIWGGQNRADVLCNSFVGNKAVTGAASNNTTAWYGGDFPKAIMYREGWGVEVTQAPPQSPEEFHRDVMMQWKFSECGDPFIQNPRFIFQGNK